MRTQSILLVLIGLLLVACGGSPSGDSEPKTETKPAAQPEAMIDVANLCVDMGPQAPRDLSKKEGANTTTFPLAPRPERMNLCNIYTTTNAEHRGPGFRIFVDDTNHGGYACNKTAALSKAEKKRAPGAFKGVRPGDTIEVHWMYTSCDATPGEGLEACIPEGCSNPQLRVEAQAFLVVNDSDAVDFTTMAYDGNQVNGRHQAKQLPKNAGKPIVYRGSTTGPKYTQETCSETQVTWSVRPQCVKLDINSLHRWAKGGNVFNENKPRGVRQLVTAPQLLSPIE